MSTVPLDLETDMVVLPPPALPPQISLGSALKGRRSTRTFLPDPLPLETLSLLLWTGFGVNRTGTHGRTAPSAHDWQEIEVFVVLAEGAYRYDPRQHRLLLVSAEVTVALVNPSGRPRQALSLAPLAGLALTLQ